MPVRKIRRIVTGRGSAAGGGGSAFYTNGFETGDFSYAVGGTYMVPDGSSAPTIQAAAAKTGAYGMRMRYPATADNVDSNCEGRFFIGVSNLKEIWYSYDLFVPSNYYHRTSSDGVNNNKGFFYIWGGDYASPHTPGMGPNFWPRVDGASWASFYLWNSDVTYFDPETGNTEDGEGHYYVGILQDSIELADRGKWLKIVGHYKLAATSSSFDGSAEIWKTRDGVEYKLLQLLNKPFYRTGQTGWTEGYIFGWSNSGFDQQTDLYVDNFTLSTTSLR